MSGPPQVIQPLAWGRDEKLPPLGLIPAGSFSLEELAGVKRREQVPVHVVFPVGRAREAQNLRQLLTVVQPLVGVLIDQVWIAFGGGRLGGIQDLARHFPEVQVFPARRFPPPDQEDCPPGKGATMRAWLYHLVMSGQVTHPRAVIEFIDADIRPACFHDRWVVDPVGAVLWFAAVDAAKVVYHRPRGGRLNAMVRALLALCPHPGVQVLQKLAYVLSGEMAGTLRFWTSLPFKSGYGVETLHLLSLALDRLQLTAGTADLTHLVQVYVGEMDHRHAPLTSTPRQRGLDQMGGAVFHTLLEALTAAGELRWRRPPLAAPRLQLPYPDQGSAGGVAWLAAPMAEATLAPLATRTEVLAALARRGP